MDTQLQALRTAQNETVIRRCLSLIQQRKARQESARVRSAAPAYLIVALSQSP